MGWQAIAGGANGLVFYAYQHLFEPHDDPDDAFEPAWARTKAMAAEFKKYIDVFLSVDQAPTAKSSNGDVAVRTWRHQGDTYLLAVNCTTNAQTATIALSEPLGKVVAVDFAPEPEIDGKKVRVALEPISYLMLRAQLRGGCLDGAKYGIIASRYVELLREDDGPLPQPAERGQDRESRRDGDGRLPGVR